MDRFLELRNNHLFHEIGPGFLLTIVPEAHRANSISIEMEIGAREKAPLKGQFGMPADRELYNTVQYIQSVLNNRSQDLSLTLDNSGEARPQ
jgi:hypothetical protein